MKNLPIISLLIIGLASCGTDNTPTPQRMTQNVQSIPGNTVISVVSQDKYDAPHGAEIIEKKGSYRVIDNIYDTDGYQVYSDPICQDQNLPFLREPPKILSALSSTSPSTF